jgi:hypothetical protein
MPNDMDSRIIALRKKFDGSELPQQLKIILDFQKQMQDIKSKGKKINPKYIAFFNECKKKYNENMKSSGKPHTELREASDEIKNRVGYIKQESIKSTSEISYSSYSSYSTPSYTSYTPSGPCPYYKWIHNTITFICEKTGAECNFKAYENGHYTNCPFY